LLQRFQRNLNNNNHISPWLTQAIEQSHVLQTRVEEARLQLHHAQEQLHDTDVRSVHAYARAAVDYISKHGDWIRQKTTLLSRLVEEVVRNAERRSVTLFGPALHARIDRSNLPKMQKKYFKQQESVLKRAIELEAHTYRQMSSTQGQVSLSGGSRTPVLNRLLLRHRVSRLQASIRKHVHDFGEQIREVSERLFDTIVNIEINAIRRGQIDGWQVYEGFARIEVVMAAYGRVYGRRLQQ
jgi:hypothetical protein